MGRTQVGSTDPCSTQTSWEDSQGKEQSYQVGTGSFVGTKQKGMGEAVLEGDMQDV